MHENIKNNNFLGKKRENEDTEFDSINSRLYCIYNKEIMNKEINEKYFNLKNNNNNCSAIKHIGAKIIRFTSSDTINSISNESGNFNKYSDINYNLEKKVSNSQEKKSNSNCDLKTLNDNNYIQTNIELVCKFNFKIIIVI